MYLLVQRLLELGPAVGDVVVAALTSPQAVRDVLPTLEMRDPLLQHLQQVSQSGPLVLDLWGADRHLTREDREKIVRAIRDYWSHHGFCLVRCNDLQHWTHAAVYTQQPLLHWRSLSPQTGWDLLGVQLRAVERAVFRLLVSHGTVTVEQVATNSTIFSQCPQFSDPHVQMDIAMGRMPQGPITINRSEARRILTRMHQLRLVTMQNGFYHVVRPTRDNGV